MSDEHLISLGKAAASALATDPQIFNHQYFGSKIQELALKHLTVWKDESKFISLEDYSVYEDDYAERCYSFLYEVLDLMGPTIEGLDGRGAMIDLKDLLTDVLSTDLADYITPSK